MDSPRKPLKVLLLGASFNTRNMGVGALAAGAIKAIRNAHPDADIRLLDYARGPATCALRVGGTDVLVELINLRFSKRLFLSNNIALLVFLAALSRLLPGSLRALVVGNNRTLAEIESSDIAASLAGGDSFSDIYGLTRFLYVTLPQVLVVLMGRPLVQLPQTIGPFRGWLARLMARRILGRSELIYSRDYPGLAEAREILGVTGRQEKIRFCYDLGFVLDPEEPQAATTEAAAFDGALAPSCTVGFNVSGLLYMGGYTRDNMFGLKTDYRLLVNEIIDFIITRKKARVMLVPHVVGSGEHAESDSAVCERLFSELGPRYGSRISVVTGSFDQAGIKHIIGKCDFFIGSRMHACIAALSQCVPAVPIAYSRKFAGVMETIGMESYVADPCRLDPGAVIDIIDRAFEDREAIAERLRSRMPAVKDRVMGLFGEIRGSARRGD